MSKIIYTIFILFSINCLGFSQEVKSNNKIEKVGTTNEYNITTTITGLQGVDIARINYMVADDETYKASSKNIFFSDRNAEHIKFYIMGIPNDGKIVIYLGIITKPLTQPLNIPVEFQYSRNEEKHTINLPPVVLGEDLVAENTPTVLNESANKNSKIDETTTKKVSASSTDENMITQATPAENVVTTTSALPKEEKKIPKEVVAKEVNTQKDITETTSTATKILPKKATNTTENIVNQSNTSENTPVATTRTSKKFTVQILALSQFSQSKLNVFCQQHNLLLSEISKKQINGLMKIRYGVANSKAEAQKLRNSLLNKGIIGAFVVTIE